MSKPFKFRYVNEITGAFVLLVVALLVAGVILAGHAQGWFTPQYRLTLRFPPEGSLGVQEGTRVVILDTTVGTVDKMTVPEDGAMLGRAKIKGDFFRFVRSDSQAIVKKAFGIAGETFVQITKGTGAPLPKEGAELLCLNDTEMLKQIQGSLDKLQATVDEYRQLAADLRSTNGPLMQFIGHLNQIAAGLEKGEGPAGKLLRDPAMAQQLAELVAQVQKILADVKQTTAQLPGLTKTVGGEVQDASGLVLQTQAAIRETEKLIEGLQRHWLLRTYVDQVEPPARIPPQAVPAGPGGGK
jgi:phospholipid/cholesterol/gamma-HCH transport system substrate-binding protein